MLTRYGLALAMAALALLIRSALPVPTGTTVYQLPLAAVLLSGWFGGRGPGLLALVVCAASILYRFIPPEDSFSLPSEYALGFGIFISLGLLLIQFCGVRRRVEQALRASEERFRALVQFSFDVYWETDTAHRFTRQEFSERLTHPPDRTQIGKTPWEVPYVEPDEEGWRNYRATVDARLPYRDFELARPTAVGGVRYLSASGIPAFDADGRFVGYRGVGRHITEQKRAEAEHRAHVWFLESMDRINRALQATNDIERMMSEVLNAVLDIYACDRAWLLYPCDPQAPSWRAVMEHTRPEFPGAFALQTELALDAQVAAVFAAARASAGALRFGPDGDRELPAGAAERFTIRSQMAMALHPKGDQPYLFGVHQCSRTRSWTKDEQRLFEEIGHRLNDALSSLIAFRSLRESEARLERSQRVAHVGWWERDYETGRVSLSDEACRIFGVRPLDHPHSHDRWVSLIHPDDRQKAAEASDAALRGVGRYDVECRVVRPDGVTRVVHIHGDITRDDAGHPVREFGVLQDITERKRAEESLRQSEAYLAEAQRLSHTGSWALDVANDKYIYTSYEFDRMYGFDTRAQPLTTELFVERIHPEDRSSWKETQDKSRREKVDTAHEYRIVLPDGDVRHLHVIRHPVLNDAGEVVQLIGTSIDITERKRAEQALHAKDNALHAARTELAHVSRLTTLGELTASIAHEVSQPLGGMTSSAGACARWLAAEPPDMVKAHRALDSIVADGKRAREVIARIRALSQRQAPRMEFLDINREVVEVVALTEHELRTHQIVLQTQLQARLPRVRGDRVQLQQVLLNLIVNAIEAMGDVRDRPRELTIVSQRHGDGEVVIEVRDSGPGFGNARVEQLFDAFYTTKDEGLGIGLSISRSIVETHGGKLSASANHPHGAVFRFSLPVMPA